MLNEFYDYFIYLVHNAYYFIFPKFFITKNNFNYNQKKKS